MSATLVIMAAGLASRYGGAKQIEKVGPGGEILMEYTIHDAQRAGFDRFVIILQPQMLEDFRAVCGERLEGKAHVDYAFQSFDALPDWFAVPEGPGSAPRYACCSDDRQWCWHPRTARA